MRFAFLAVLLVPTLARADDISFNRDVRPILSNHCFKCHGPSKQESGLRLDQRESAMRRKLFVPGQSNKLLKRVTGDDDERMPPAEAGEKLKPQQVAVLKAWIDEGARYEAHWAFQKPVHPPIPSVKDAAAVRNPIDQFIVARLESAGLKPSPAADRPTLIRRLSLDLLGLLPSPDAVEAFVNDQREDAYERLVDRLLASPHYGERQARHWLDLGRYADTNGYSIDGTRMIWPWRDWVIAALNRDLPFDQFTIEQLAGDQLPDAKIEQLVATGFQRNTPINEEGGTDAEQFRAERNVDRTNTVGSVWLGLTVGCCQCHSHKYDPLTHQEYFQLYSFFNRADEAKINLTTPEQAKKLADLTAEVELVRKKGDADLLQKAAKEQKAFEASLVSTLVLRDGFNKNRVTTVHLRGDFLGKGDKVEPGTFAVLPPLKAKGPATRLDLARWLVSAEQPLTPRVVVNRAWQQFFGKGLVETENDFGMQGTLPTHPELLDWLAVEFVRPSLQEEVRPWSMKALHKLIVTSATYRQASIYRADLLGKDPKNVLLGRQNRLRLEAEIIRDAALSASGLLATTIGGPPVFPPQPPELGRFTQVARAWVESKGPDRFRRGMYTFIQRQAQHPLLTTFDGADAQTACTKRNRSNTPLQALHLANDPAFIELAEGLGKRIERDGPADADGRIDFAYHLCFARVPSSGERDRLLSYVQQHQTSAVWSQVARALINLDEFITRE